MNTTLDQLIYETRYGVVKEPYETGANNGKNKNRKRSDERGYAPAKGGNRRGVRKSG